MKFMRLGAVGAERPVVLADDGVAYDLASITEDIDGNFLERGGIAATAAALAAHSLPVFDDPADGSGLRIGAPIARPWAVICIGMNYAAHAAESGALPPEDMVVFFKHPNTVVGPFDDVAIPVGSSRTDWEVELAVVIGKKTRYLSSPAEAVGHIAGYAISNDVSERRLQIEVSGGQWSKGKSAETFNPLGPWLVPQSEIGDGAGLGLRSSIDGQARQDSTTDDMVFDVSRIVYELSQVMTLEPGDVINTGTPAGVALSGRFPYLRPGNTFECSIDGLGSQSQRIVQGVA
jgi:2,4-diketo-3-deoxy-L-fuconate hydrolase